MAIWFTSDTHFFHKNIIEYSKRPYDSVEEMNEKLILNWNSVVQPTDTVYHLGDFGFAPKVKLESVFNRLNGQKFLLRGNHDDDAEKLGWGWVKERYELYVREPEKQMIVLSHYAHKVWNKSHHGSIMLFGHSHGSLQGDSQSLDVGVDCWDYTPVGLEDIKRRLKKQPERMIIDHHGRKDE